MGSLMGKRLAVFQKSFPSIHSCCVFFFFVVVLGAGLKCKNLLYGRKMFLVKFYQIKVPLLINWSSRL